jgi:hypothetical protein
MSFSFLVDAVDSITRFCPKMIKKLNFTEEKNVTKNYLKAMSHGKPNF